MQRTNLTFQRNSSFILSMRASRARLAQRADAIASHFFRYFSLHVAQTDYEKRLCFQTRHQVYCEELKLLPVNKKRMATDEFDDYSLACFIRHKASGACAGTVRIVLPRYPGQMLPAEKFCQSALRLHELHPNTFARPQIAEVSSMAIPARFRRRATDRAPLLALGLEDNIFDASGNERFFPHMATALYLFALTVCEQMQIPHSYLLINHRQAEHMRRVGMKLVAMGKDVDLFGIRRAYHCVPAEVIQCIPIDLFLYQAELRQQLNSVVKSMLAVRRAAGH